PDGTITVARAGNDLALFWFGSIEANTIVAYGTHGMRCLARGVCPALTGLPTMQTEVSRRGVAESTQCHSSSLPESIISGRHRKPEQGVQAAAEKASLH